METESKDELFSLRLNNTGIAHLLKFAGLTKAFLIAGIILSFIIFIRDAISLLSASPGYPDRFVSIFFSIYPYLSLGTTIVFILQIVYYRKLGTAIKYAIENADEIEFNQAFENLVKGIWFAFAVAGFSYLFAIADLIISIKFRI